MFWGPTQTYLVSNLKTIIKTTFFGSPTKQNILRRPEQIMGACTLDPPGYWPANTSTWSHTNFLSHLLRNIHIYAVMTQLSTVFRNSNAPPTMDIISNVTILNNNQQLQYIWTYEWSSALRRNNYLISKSSICAVVAYSGIFFYNFSRVIIFTWSI
jgi:hypothetical protein